MKTLKVIFVPKIIHFNNSFTEKIAKNFWKIRTQSNSLTLTRHFWLLQALLKLFLLGQGIDVTPQGKRLLAWSIATVLKGESVAMV